MRGVVTPHTETQLGLRLSFTAEKFATQGSRGSIEFLACDEHGRLLGRFMCNPFDFSIYTHVKGAYREEARLGRKAFVMAWIRSYSTCSKI